MQKSKFPRTLVVVILLTLAIGLAPAANAQANPKAAASLINPASSPWNLGWVDNSTSTNVGAYPSVAYNPDDDLPYISYYDAVNGDLMLASPRSSGGNCGTGNKWWCRVVDGNGVNGRTTDNVGEYSSIDFWEGTYGPNRVWKLGIAYRDSTINALKYAEYTQYPASGSWDFQTILSTNTAGSYLGLHSSLKYDSHGEPIVAYNLVTTLTSHLFLAHRGAIGGNCGEGPDLNTWQCDLVDYGPGIGQSVSLGLDFNGLVNIAYYDAGNGNLKFANYYGQNIGNCGVPANYYCEMVDGADADVGLSASMAGRWTSGPLRIVYYDRTNGKLKQAYRTASNANCGGGWWWCGDVDTIGTGLTRVGIDISTDKNGYPIIAYEDASASPGVSKLKIARAAAAIGLFWGNCGDKLPGEYLTYWQCTTLDSAAYGQGMVDVADYVAVAVAKSGLATVAYREVNNDEHQISLKYATQMFQTVLPLVKR